MARGAKAVVRPPLPIAEEQFAYPLARDAERFLDHLLHQRHGLANMISRRQLRNHPTPLGMNLDLAI